MSSRCNLLWQEGERAASKGDLDHAARSYQAALQETPDHVPSLLGMSLVCSRRDEHRNAHQFAMAAWRASPKSAPLLFGVAQRLRYFNEYQALVDCLSSRHFQEQAPPRILAEAAVALSAVGANTEAQGLVDRALRLDPKNAAALYFRGNLHTFSGEFEQAEQRYEACLQSDPRMFQASWMLASLRKQTAEANHVGRLREQLRKVTPGGKGEVYVCFALHKELHDLADYAGAWTALERACRVERTLHRYDPDAAEQMMLALRQTCSKEFLSQASGVRLSSTPIFIVGMFRSGTSLLERMLAGHPWVTDGGETHAFAEQMKRATDHAPRTVMDGELVRRALAADFDQVAKGYDSMAAWLSRGRSHFTEKLPSNFLHVGYIAKALPGAKIVHMVRDPVDTCFANLRTLFSETAAYSYDPCEMARYYNAYRRLMEHWRETLGGRVLDVHYAELVADPERVIRQVADHCGLPFDRGMLDVGRQGGAVVTASAAQVRSGITRDRGGAWRPYAGQLREMIELLGAETEAARA